MGVVDLNGIRLRNRLVTSASLLGYGASKRRLILYGLSPIAQWVPLERFGAVTTRTMTLEPREGHFTLREDWGVTEFPAMLRLYGKALRRVDAGWLNAFGWSNIGIERYFDEYFDRTADLNRIISIGGFSADEIVQLVETVNERAKPGEIAAIELNASCHNVNFPFETILEESLARAVPRSRHPVILKVSPDEDYGWQARLAEQHGCAGITAINTVKGLRLDPDTGEPWLKNRYGAISGPAIKPIGLRVVAELRDAGIRLPIIANGGIRDFDDCREYFWAGRRRREPRVGRLAPADAALRAWPGRGPAHPPPDLAGGRVHAARRRAALAAGDAEPASPMPSPIRLPRRRSRASGRDGLDRQRQQTGLQDRREPGRRRVVACERDLDTAVGDLPVDHRRRDRHPVEREREVVADVRPGRVGQGCGGRGVERQVERRRPALVAANAGVGDGLPGEQRRARDGITRVERIRAQQDDRIDTPVAPSSSRKDVLDVGSADGSGTSKVIRSSLSEDEKVPMP